MLRTSGVTGGGGAFIAANFLLAHCRFNNFSIAIKRRALCDSNIFRLSQTSDSAGDQNAFEKREGSVFIYSLSRVESLPCRCLSIAHFFLRTHVGKIVSPLGLGTMLEFRNHCVSTKTEQ